MARSKSDRHDLSDRYIDSLKLPSLKKNSIAYPCRFESGLSLIVKWRHRAIKTESTEQQEPVKSFLHVWRLRYSNVNDQRTSIDLGYWPAMNQDAAIAAARAVKVSVLRGVDPKQAKQLEQEMVIPKVVVNESSSISHLLHEFLEWRRKHYPEKKTTNDYYKKHINNHIMPRWGLFSIDVISQWSWQEYIREIKKSISDHVARHVHATMRVAISYAVQSDDFPSVNANPLLGLKVVAELKKTVRSRYLSHTELSVFMNEIDDKATSVTQRNIIKLQLYQGLRISEILNIKISNLGSLTHSEIQVTVKGGKAGYTMLSDQAIEIVKGQMRHLIENDVKSTWLFPQDNDSNLNYNTVQAGSFIKQIRRDWIQFASHDLRRTCRTWLGEFECTKEMRDKICNHATPTGKDASYDHGKRKNEQLRWMQLWADKLDLIKNDPNAFEMDSDTSIDASSANELADLLGRMC